MMVFFPLPCAPDIDGYVEAPIGGGRFQVAWRVSDGLLTVAAPNGRRHVARRSAACGTAEDQARGLAIELWLALHQAGAFTSTHRVPARRA